MSRLVLGLAELALLVGDEYRRTIRLPWHDEDLDRDVVTNGQAALIWNGRQFSPTPDPDNHPPSDALRAYLEPAPVIGHTSLPDIRAWCAEDYDTCDSCGGRTVHRCASCGETSTPDRPGLFCGAVINRWLLSLYLSPLPFGDDAVEVRQSASGPVQLIADSWTVVIMPMNEKRVTPRGEPFVVAVAAARETAAGPTAAATAESLL